MENMFIYTVKWNDCDGAGYAEEGIEYKGTSREEALAAKKYCDRTSFYGSISIEVVGRKEIMEEAENFNIDDIDELEAEAEEAYYNSLSPSKIDLEKDIEEYKEFDFDENLDEWFEYGDLEF